MPWWSFCKLFSKKKQIMGHFSNMMVKELTFITFYSEPAYEIRDNQVRVSSSRS